MAELTLAGNSGFHFTFRTKLKIFIIHFRATNEHESVNDRIDIKVEKGEVVKRCEDKPEFARCDLIVKAKMCNKNPYYQEFCCKSCSDAGLLGELESGPAKEEEAEAEDKAEDEAEAGGSGEGSGEAAVQPEEGSDEQIEADAAEAEIVDGEAEESDEVAEEEAEGEAEASEEVLEDLAEGEALEAEEASEPEVEAEETSEEASETEEAAEATEEEA